jgi:CheY-like chemotaxis protein
MGENPKKLNKLRFALVVEDDPNINHALCEALGNEGYTVVSKTNGEEALSYLLDTCATQKLSLLVTDGYTTNPNTHKGITVSGDKLVCAARNLFPQLSIILQTNHPNPDFDKAAGYASACLSEKLLHIKGMHLLHNTIHIAKVLAETAPALEQPKWLPQFMKEEELADHAAKTEDQKPHQKAEHGPHSAAVRPVQPRDSTSFTTSTSSRLVPASSHFTTRHTLSEQAPSGTSRTFSGP